MAAEAVDDEDKNVAAAVVGNEDEGDMMVVVEVLGKCHSQ